MKYFSEKFFLTLGQNFYTMFTRKLFSGINPLQKILKIQVIEEELSIKPKDKELEWKEDKDEDTRMAIENPYYRKKKIEDRIMMS